MKSRYNVYYNFVSPVTGRILADNGYVLIGNNQGIAIPAANITINNLPNLTSGKIWIGDVSNRPIEGDPPAGPPGPQGPKGDTPKVTIGDVITALKTAYDFYNGKILLESIAKTLKKLGLMSVVGLGGLGGLAGTNNSKNNNKGAAVTSGTPTILLNSNLDIQGNRIENIAQSPGGDFDAVSARFVWDLLNDNVIIKWK